MTKYIFILSVAVALDACSGKGPRQETAASEGTLPTRYAMLSKAFDELDKDTLYVYSAWEPGDGNFAFKGHRMDSGLVRMMPPDVQVNYDWQKDIGACYKFSLGPGRMGLIARSGGQYVASAIKLLIYDLKKDSVVNAISLADAEGDAGEGSVYNSCLIRSPHNGLYIIMYAHESYDHTIADANPGQAVENWNYYYLYELRNGITDTLSTDSAAITNRYPSIIKKLSTEY